MIDLERVRSLCTSTLAALRLIRQNAQFPPEVSAEMLACLNDVETEAMSLLEELDSYEDN